MEEEGEGASPRKFDDKQSINSEMTTSSRAKKLLKMLTIRDFSQRKIGLIKAAVEGRQKMS